MANRGHRTGLRESLRHPPKTMEPHRHPLEPCVEVASSLDVFGEMHQLELAFDAALHTFNLAENGKARRDFYLQASCRAVGQCL